MTQTDHDAESQQDPENAAEQASRDDAEDAQFESVPSAPPTVIKKGGAVSWLALLLALGALSLQGWVWWNGQQGTTEDPAAVAESALADVRASVASDLATSRDQVAEQRGRLDSLVSRVDEIQQRSREDRDTLRATSGTTEDLNSDVDVVQRQLAGLERRYNVIEQSVASLADMQSGGVTVMDLAETEYLLRLAGERLALFGDPDTALRALRLADTQLRAVNDPLYDGVRQTLAEEMEALRQVEMPDRIGLSGRLLTLAESVYQWPLASAVEEQEAAEEPTQTQEEPGLWEKAKSVASTLVVVEQEAGRDSPLLSPEREQAMRDGIALEFRTARLALLNADHALYRHSLEEALKILNEKFNIRSEPVMTSVASIQELLDVDFEPAMPSLDRTLRQLRGLRAAAGADA